MATVASKKVSPIAEASYAAATRKLASTVNEIQVVVNNLNNLSATSEDLSDAIASKEERIKSLDGEYAEKRRSHNVEFELKVKEDGLKVAENILASQSLVAVPKHELEGLRKDFTDLQTGFDDKVKAEVGKATGIVKSHFESTQKLLEAQFQTKEAENIASIKSLNVQVIDLKNQVEMWKAQLNDERKASVDRAKAGQIGTLNVGSQGPGR